MSLLDLEVELEPKVSQESEEDWEQFSDIITF